MLGAAAGVQRFFSIKKCGRDCGTDVGERGKKEGNEARWEKRFRQALGEKVFLKVRGGSP